MQHIIFMYQYIITWWNSLDDTNESQDADADNTVFDDMYQYK